MQENLVAQMNEIVSTIIGTLQREVSTQQLDIAEEQASQINKPSIVTDHKCKRKSNEEQFKGPRKIYGSARKFWPGSNHKFWLGSTCKIRPGVTGE